MTEQFVRNDYTIHRDGDRNADIAIAFIHDVSASAWCFGAMAKYFVDKGFCVYRIDLPGHGVRKDPHELMSLTRCIRASRDFVTEVAEAHTHVYVVGHSMRGLITHVLGNKASVDGIALLAPSPTEGIPFESFGFGDFAGTHARASKRTLKSRGLIHNHIAQFFTDPDDPVVDVWVKERIFDPLSVATRLRYSPPKMHLPKPKDLSSSSLNMTSSSSLPLNRRPSMLFD